MTSKRQWVLKELANGPHSLGDLERAGAEGGASAFEDELPKLADVILDLKNEGLVTYKHESAGVAVEVRLTEKGMAEVARLIQ